MKNLKLSAEEIKANWDKLFRVIDKFIQEPRKQQLKDFYKKYEERLIMMPASHKIDHHNAFPGGYVDHVLRVIEGSLLQLDIWKRMGSNINFTTEELVFSALNHDLGKMGDSENEFLIPQDDKWRMKNMGEMYKFNTDVPFASVPDRSLFLLQEHGIKYTFNEMVAIQTHDGLYDEANKKYLMTWLSETKPRTSLVYILHQADMMASRIEWEKQFKGKFGMGGKKIEVNKTSPSKPKEEKQPKTKLNVRSKSLQTIKSEELTDLLKEI